MLLNFSRIVFIFSLRIDLQSTTTRIRSSSKFGTNDRHGKLKCLTSIIRADFIFKCKYLGLKKIQLKLFVNLF